eukprot:tig00020611_g12103.t1
MSARDEDSDLTDEEWDEDVEFKTDDSADTTGMRVYIRKCEEFKIVPVSQLVERIEEDYIDLHHYGLGEKGGRAVAECLKVNKTIKGINLGDNNIVRPRLRRPAGVYRARRLRENRFASRFSWAMGETLASHTCALVELCLRGNRLGDKDIGMLCSALVKNNVLLKLDISHNSLGERCAFRMLGGNSTLTDVDVSWNQIVRRGAVALANVLKVNSALTRFRMGWNSLGDPGAAVLGEALGMNQSLKLLDISHNRIGAEGIRMISTGLMSNSTLLVLHAQHNLIKDSGSRPLAEAIYGVTSCLTDVDFRSCEMPPEIVRPPRPYS